MTPRKPVEQMVAAELLAVLDSLTRTQLTSMLVFLSGAAPSAFDAALNRYAPVEGEH